MILRGRLEVLSGWNYVATHLAGIDNVLADVVSR